ncbi:MAG TPA: co-chaperone GroES [Candidatus Angelobacter sp.]|nr:co-chaperone GroES [Candidatus Angelobacter sp.]
MNGRCLNDQVLVLRSDPKESQGLIIIPDSAQEKSEEGVVVAVGPGPVNEATGERIPLGVKPGDCVKFSKYYGTEVRVGGILFLQLHECEIEFAAG